MGMQSGKIPNNRITASSSLDKYHAPYLARLHRNMVRGRSSKTWSAAVNNHGQWIRVDFGREAKIVRVSIQGSANADHWVTSFRLSYSLDFVHYVYYKYKDSEKVL